MSESGKNTAPVDLIIKQLSGEISTDELIDLENWKAKDPENEIIFNQYKKIWDNSGRNDTFADIDIDEEWDNFLMNAGLSEEGIFDTFQIKTKKTKNLHLLSRSFIKIAAVLLIGLVLGYSAVLIYRFSFFEKVVASEVTKFELPDGSVSTLNIGSTLIYPKNFTGNERKINLNGEAFFEIKADPKKPFMVESGNLIVEVIGTSFNLDAYKDKGVVILTVESGNVAAYSKNNTDEKSYLNEGDRLVYSRKPSSFITTNNSDPNYNAWKTKKLVFYNSTIRNVAETLKEVYHVEIMTEPQVDNCRITVSFENKSLDYILKTLMETMNFTVEKKRNIIIIKGQGC